MAGLARALRRRVADERGFTLPELLVATIIALMVAAGGMLVLQIAVRTQPQVSERAAQIQQGRTLMETISRELRQGESVEAATESSLEVMTYVSSSFCGSTETGPATLCRVTYTCAEGSCSRTEHGDSGGGTTTQVATGLLHSSVFSYCDATDTGTACDLTAASYPTYVGLELAYPSDDGEEAITLADGVALRNHFAPGPET